MKLAVSADVSLYFETRGEGEALVLLNGMSQTTANWMSQVRHLSQRYQVVTWDTRGQGRSDLGPDPLTLDLHTDDLCALLDELSIERAHVCGFSYGARLAMGFGARCPERTGKLVLTSLGDGRGALRRLIVRSWLEVLDRGGLEAMAWSSLPQILGEDFLARHEEHLDSMVRVTLARNTESGLRALLQGLSSFGPIEQDAARCAGEVLVISADQDPLVGPKAARGLADLFKKARYKLVEGFGHTLPVEAPDVWRELVVDFLG